MEVDTELVLRGARLLLDEVPEVQGLRAFAGRRTVTRRRRRTSRVERLRRISSNPRAEERYGGRAGPTRPSRGAGYYGYGWDAVYSRAT